MSVQISQQQLHKSGTYLWNGIVPFYHAARGFNGVKREHEQLDNVQCWYQVFGRRFTIDVIGWFNVLFLGECESVILHSAQIVASPSRVYIISVETAEIVNIYF